jgi:hypothetical protein
MENLKKNNNNNNNNYNNNTFSGITTNGLGNADGVWEYVSYLVKRMHQVNLRKILKLVRIYTNIGQSKSKLDK